MEYSGKISESLKPTYKNITEEFITNTLYVLLCKKDNVNFLIRFTELEAREYIDNKLCKMAKEGKFWERKAKEIAQKLYEDEKWDCDMPIMVISDYKKFFDYLTELCEENVKQYFKSTQNASFPWYERTNCLEQVWLRMAPEDFNNPEEFLRQQVEMARDTTFTKYDDEVCLGRIKSLGDNFLCVQNTVGRTWDEASQQMQVTIYDKNWYENKELWWRPHYTLPVIRYGIVRKNGRKVCKIYSIQTKDTQPEQDQVHKKVDRAKYKVNKGLSQEDTVNVEPKNLIVLSLFVDLLNREGITDIEAQGVYVLDYDFHLKRSEKLIKEFNKRWTDEKKAKQPDMYMKEKKILDKTYNKEDLISEIKTERFIKTFQRLLQHYPKGRIDSYPTEADSCIHISIPRIKNSNDIEGELLQELYGLVDKQYSDIEI